MKKIIGLILVLIALTFVSGIEANAQMRIQFAKGKSAATVRGNTGSYGVYYTLRARGGQKIALDFSPAAKLGVKVEREGGDEVLLRAERGGFYEIYLEEGGNFSIFVGSRSGDPVSFSLTVKITKMTDV
jgi:hypothetical protein